MNLADALNQMLGGHLLEDDPLDPEADRFDKFVVVEGRREDNYPGRKSGLLKLPGVPDDDKVTTLLRHVHAKGDLPPGCEFLWDEWAAGAEQPAFDDSTWGELRLPHDWAIDGPFDSTQNPHTGALPIFGTGWYRKTFTLAATATGRFDALVYGAGLYAGTLAFAEAYPLLKGFHGSTSLGQVTIPQYFDLPYGLVVFAVVLMALGGFWGAGWVERAIAARAGRGR